MRLVTWSPFQEFENVFNRYNGLVGRNWMRDQDKAVAEWRPVANISETDSEYLIKAELPEVRKEDVEVTVHEGVITIKGDRHEQTTEESEKQHRVESVYGSFARSFALPADVDESGIRAESIDGILRVHLPKTELKQPKAIEIDVN
jgi:HSP20 family protein